jgi:hypothetical protein
MCTVNNVTYFFILYAACIYGSVRKPALELITRAHINRDEFSLTFDGEPVPQVEVIVCLGVAIDKRLTMAKHLDRLREKGAKSMTTLRYAAGQKATQ